MANKRQRRDRPGPVKLELLFEWYLQAFPIHAIGGFRASQAQKRTSRFAIDPLRDGSATIPNVLQP